MTRDTRATSPPFHIKQARLYILDESRGRVHLHLAIAESVLRTRQYAVLLRACYRYVEQSALLLYLAHRAHTHRRREDILFQPHHEDRWEFQTFRCVYRHQRHLRLLLVAFAVQIGQQRYLLQEVAQPRLLFAVLLLAALHEVLHTAQKFLQVLLSRQVLGVA